MHRDSECSEDHGECRERYYPGCCSLFWTGSPFPSSSAALSKTFSCALLLHVARVFRCASRSMLGEVRTCASMLLLNGPRRQTHIWSGAKSGARNQFGLVVWTQCSLLRTPPTIPYPVPLRRITQYFFDGVGTNSFAMSDLNIFHMMAVDSFSYRIRFQNFVHAQQALKYRFSSNLQHDTTGLARFHFPQADALLIQAVLIEAAFTFQYHSFVIDPAWRRHARSHTARIVQ